MQEQNTMFIINAQMRTPWQIMRASIYALMIRNLEQRFIMHSSRKRFLDLLKIFLEPFGHILLWMAFKLFRYQNMESGLSPELFILLGVIPWLLTLNTVSDALKIISQNKNLLVFKQIKPMDPVFALLLSELGSLALVFCCALLLFSLMGLHWQLQDPLRWLLAVTLYIFFIVGLSMLFACVGFFSRPLSRLFRLFVRFLYLFSGIFFSAQMVSAHLRGFLLWNPLFQLIEISRECFSTVSGYTLFGDMNYLFKCALMSITIGFGTYVFLRKKIMIEIMEH